MKKNRIKASWSPVQPEATKRNLIYEIVARTKYDLKEKGILYTAKFILNLCKGLIIYPYYFKRDRKFLYNEKSYSYFYHWYNVTHINERCIEIPIIKKELELTGSSRILEIGNVISHYYPVSHIVIDKYEKNIGVLNMDVMDYTTDRKFDLIVSVSTMEHIGWDERPQYPDGALLAMKKMISLLDSGGKIVITIPMGYNPYLDEQIKTKTFPYTEIYCMVRDNGNTWRQENYDTVSGIKYGEPFPYASGVLILVYSNKGNP